MLNEVRLGGGINGVFALSGFCFSNTSYKAVIVCPCFGSSIKKRLFLVFGMISGRVELCVL
jgi:hypothetical protein